MDATDGLLLERLGLQERHDGAGDDAGVEDEDVVGDVEVDAAALVLRAEEEDAVVGVVAEEVDLLAAEVHPVRERLALDAGREQGAVDAC